MMSEWAVVSRAPQEEWAVANVTRAEPEQYAPESTVLPAMGKGVVDIARGAKQRLDEGAAFLERNIDGGRLSRLLGLPTAQESQKATQADIDESRKVDAPLMGTAGGKFGHFLGQLGPALLTSVIPGANTLAGSVMMGGGFGAATPTSGDESVLENVALGAAGGALGYGAGRGISAVVKKKLAARATEKAANVGRDAAAVSAREAGYTIPPSQTNPTLSNRILEGISGKIQTGQRASKMNQDITQRLAAADIGLTPDKLNVENLGHARRVAGVFYEELKKSGKFVPDKQFQQELQQVMSTQIQEFPSLFNNKIAALVDDFKKPSIKADDAVEILKKLRTDSKANLKAFNDPEKLALGRAQKVVSESLEDLMDRNLSQSAPGLVDAFRGARRLIAKTHAIEDAMNETTGIVDARKIAKGMTEATSGNLRKIGEAAQAFPKALQDVSTQSVLPISPLDLWAGLGIGGIGYGAGLPALYAGAVGRPAIRAGILSAPYQKLFGTPAYGVNPILRALPEIAPAAGITGALSNK